VLAVGMAITGSGCLKQGLVESPFSISTQNRIVAPDSAKKPGPSDYFALDVCLGYMTHVQNWYRPHTEDLVADDTLWKVTSKFQYESRSNWEFRGEHSYSAYNEAYAYVMANFQTRCPLPPPPGAMFLFQLEARYSENPVFQQKAERWWKELANARTPVEFCSVYKKAAPVLDENGAIDLSDTQDSVKKGGKGANTLLSGMVDRIGNVIQRVGSNSKTTQTIDSGDQVQVTRTTLWTSDTLELGLDMIIEQSGPGGSVDPELNQKARELRRELNEQLREGSVKKALERRIRRLVEDKLDLVDANWRVERIIAQLRTRSVEQEAIGGLETQMRVALDQGNIWGFVIAYKTTEDTLNR
jgi:hypothetical protein